jgi:hypothetical protein
VILKERICRLFDKYSIYPKLGLRIPIRINDFKAIEAAILKNKAYEELNSQISPIKNYPKSMLASYELGLMYERWVMLKPLASINVLLN